MRRTLLAPSRRLGSPEGLAIREAEQGGTVATVQTKCKNLPNGHFSFSRGKALPPGEHPISIWRGGEPQRVSRAFPFPSKVASKLVRQGHRERGDPGRAAPTFGRRSEGAGVTAGPRGARAGKVLLTARRSPSRRPGARPAAEARPGPG